MRETGRATAKPPRTTLACVAPHSAVRVAAVALFVCFCAALAAAACVWASRVDVGAWFARSKASLEELEEDEVAMATTFKQGQLQQ